MEIQFERLKQLKQMIQVQDHTQFAKLRFEINLNKKLENS